MRSTSNDLVYDSRLLYQHPYIVVFNEANEDILERVKQKNPAIEIATGTGMYNIGAGEFDIKVNHVFEMIFDADNIDSYLETAVVVKGVFALGYKSIDEIPATWSVCAWLEFPNGMPTILSGLEQKKRFYLSSKKMWSDLIDLYK